MGQGQPLRFLNQSVKNRLFEALYKGASYKLACSYAGITYQTLRTWILKAEEIAELSEEEINSHENKIYYEFYREFNRTISEAAVRWLSKIDEAMEVQWQAAAWKLERRFPEDYGKAEKELKDSGEDELLQKAKNEVTKLKEG